MGFKASVSDGRWTPGIGDPTILGWATVAAYALALVLCVLAFRVARRTPRDRTGGLWVIMATLMLALGINKQLDLQSWFSQVARDIILGQGLYEQRRTYQGAFIAAIATGGVIALGLLTWRAIRNRWPVLPLAGAAFLVSYVVIRAASFHHIDQIINLSIPGARLSSVIELGGIAIIAVGAARALRPRPHTPPPVGPQHLIEVVGRYRGNRFPS